MYQCSHGRASANVGGQNPLTSDVIYQVLNRVGIAVGPFSLLTVPGRKTGKSYTLPVAPLEHNDQRWLVSPWGTVNWVQNARASGVITLTRGHVHERLGLRELTPQESAPILKAYLTRFPRVRPLFEATPQSELGVFVAEAPRHPVFQLREQPGQTR